MVRELTSGSHSLANVQVCQRRFQLQCLAQGYFWQSAPSQPVRLQTRYLQSFPFFAVLCVKVIHTKGFNGGRLSWPMEHLTARVLRCFSLWTCVRASWHQISFSKPSSFLHFFSSWLTIFLVTFFSFSLLFVFFSLPPLFLSTTSFFLESLNPKSVNSCDGVASV